VTTPGLEHVVADELRALGLAPKLGEAGGVEFEADAKGVFAANLFLRAASRVLVRVAEFRATAFHELERHARSVPWSEFLAATSSVDLRVTCKKSRLYHSDAVAERMVAAIARAVPGVAATTSEKDDDGPGGPEQLVFVRFWKDVCTVSADSSGALLHRRGYRLATAKAPIRENLAAAILESLGYDGQIPFVDPMCGSGTFAIEAAMIARKIAPGLSRTFACETWPGAPTAAIAALRGAARAKVLPAAQAPIIASDRDAGAVAAATENAERAGVARDIEFHRRPLSALEVPKEPGLLVVNPPYGDRIGNPDALRDLYAQLGNVARTACQGWRFGILAADPTLVARTKLPLDERLRFKNGGIAVRLWQGALGSE
jgi:putative N6-adenine-specific DNA methylase